MIDRRQALALGASLAAVAFSKRAWGDGFAAMPTGYVSHGSPHLAIDPVRGPELRKWGASLPRPTGIVALTPHYRARGLQIGHVGKGRALYSFPQFMRQALPPNLDYPSPDNTALVATVRDLLAPLEPTVDETREGLDHTIWMPLLHLFPKADIPVVEIALPFSSDRDLFTLGKRLAPLRYQGVFVLASGTATHNLANFSGVPNTNVTAPWATAFDSWLAQSLGARDVSALVDWRARAPSAEIAHPDDGGHYRVLLVAVGAVSHEDSFNRASFPVEGFEPGSFSKRCVELA